MRMRRPRQTRPSPLDLEVIRRDYPEHREFAESVLPLADKGHYHPSLQVPKRAREDDDEQPEPKRSRTDAGGAEIDKMRADMDALRAENERLKTEIEQLRAENERLRDASRTSAPLVKKEEVEEHGVETLSEEFDRLVEEELARISR
ncbi:uncharacterized protein J4E84_007577 [Alternaria hordeiaustralica]|uniref:uncharacterized protein n=1 Tax=Alternaria hordeiaustralica TaxID=1187925 RepID=UPI0020C3D25E|nr:uncharacterized protein J4E84_007577 [Alternaria hordeiaustralica]KAI4681341.1 hypothetical protein J4E84_007577 [Alternaria hordeiaustralica]